MDTFWTVLTAAGIPSAMTGFLFGLAQWRINKADEKHKREQAEMEQRAAERDAAREKHEILLVESVGAAIALGEATARAVQRIPDAHCNGDMKSALNYAAEMKHKQKTFLTEQGLHNIYVDD